MIDIEQAKKEFDKYTKMYDLNNENLNRKYYHTYRVMNLSKQVAKSLNLNEEEVKLAQLIGLLHDIARFEQYTKYQTFSDVNSIDHGDLGVQILEKDSFIRKFIKENNYDNLILKAIKKHNKLEIDENVNEKELLFCKIIRDADKIDILYEATTLFYQSKEEIDEIENGYILDDTLSRIKKEKLLIKGPNSNKLDSVLTCLCFIFDLNFEYSFNAVKENHYLDKIIDRFNFKNQDTKEKIEEIRKIVNNYQIKDDKY